VAGQAVPRSDIALREAILHEDARLFAAVFDTCDLGTVGAIITDDFEFYHDKHGMVAQSKADFVKAIGTSCEERRSGTDFHARRELVADSVVVYPMKDYGAIEIGAHRFYEHADGKPEHLSSVARFTHLWKEDNGVWKVARVLSYDHQDAP
jgi:hypothetical protein